MFSNTTGAYNTAVGGADTGGVGPLRTNTTGSYNVAMGNGALSVNTTASNNTAVGYQAGFTKVGAGDDNVFIGRQAGYFVSTGEGNTYVGAAAGPNSSAATTGSYNSFFGYGAGSTTTTGAKNTIIGRFNGNQHSLDIRTSSNFIVLSDGDGNPRGVFDGSGNLGIGTASPTTKLHVKETTAATPSARLQNANSAGAKYLSFDYDGSGGSYGNFQTQASTIVLQSGFNTGKIQLTPYNSGTYSATLGLVVDTNGGVAVSSTLAVGAATPSTSGAGITFPATQSASTDANTLDDYEEGTWTPTASNFTVSGTTTLSGTYTKIGRVVYFNITFANTGTIAFGTSALITLPFTGIDQSGMIAMFVSASGISQTSGKSGVQMAIDAVNSRFFTGDFTTTSAGDQLFFGGFYRVS